jgi:creatinine amidohydrolase
MTVFFAYENLTWPEIANLPRNTPLVMSLGSDYSPEQLALGLGNPKQVGLLPTYPYGWKASGVEVPNPILETVVENLHQNLVDEGFTSVYIVIPEQSGLSLNCPHLTLPSTNPNSPAESLPGNSELGKVIIIPIGHTEQHGYHLPMATDTLIIQAIGNGVAETTPERCFCLPVMPYGVSTHRQAFAGTMNIGGRAFEDFYLAVIDTLAGRGFDRFYLISGHGGNSSFLVNVVKYSGEKHRRIFCATSWLYLSGRQGVAALDQHRQSAIGGMGHACELETSLILALRPELVFMDRAVDEMDFITTPEYYMDWVEGGALIANPPWDDDTRTGAYGAGSLGTAEKGQLWLEAAIGEKVSHISEIHEQHLRRTARRNSGYGLWGQVQNYK